MWYEKQHLPLSLIFKKIKAYMQNHFKLLNRILWNSRHYSNSGSCSFQIIYFQYKASKSKQKKRKDHTKFVRRVFIKVFIKGQKFSLIFSRIKDYNPLHCPKRYWIWFWHMSKVNFGFVRVWKRPLRGEN